MRLLYLIRGMFGRTATVLAIVCFLSLSVNAYTVIMRGGRHVEVPSRFLVTATTLTYEVSTGVQVTLQMDAIDIPATEKANNESPGSLLRRASDETRLSAGQSIAQRATKTITNRDLEASMRRRSESELAYERRRKELGLPSVAESRKRAEAESASIAGELAETRAVQQDSESYWRARASALRTEIASVDAQLGYIRRQLEEPAFPNTLGNTFGNFGSFGVINVAPFIGFGNVGGRSAFSRTVARPNIFVAPRGGTQVGGRLSFGGPITRGQVWINPLQFHRSRGINSSVFARPFSTTYVPTWQGYGVLDERSQLITQFNELSLARAGLSARWRELEEEARRAGASPGWLRP